jgi:hypothetical protein
VRRCQRKLVEGRELVSAVECVRRCCIGDRVAEHGSQLLDDALSGNADLVDVLAEDQSHDRLTHGARQRLSHEPHDSRRTVIHRRGADGS